MFAGCRREAPAESSARRPALSLAPARVAPGFHKGIAVGLYGDLFWMTRERSLDEIRALGASHVSMVVSWEQATVRSAKIRPRARPAVSDERIAALIRHARSRGLKVFLFPIVRIKYRLRRQWRGKLRPWKLDAWFRSYGRFLLHYARMAQREGVSLLSVGSELASLEKHRDRWARLIARVRKVFQGKLTYSANWDHYRQVPFWDLLDYAGLSGYFELTRSNSPSLADLIAGWQEHQRRISAWQRSVGKPLLFTEVGYHSRDGANRQPWNYRLEGPVDLQEQLDCYRAFYQVWNGSPILGGVYFWIWWGFGGPTDGTYTPRGKPAERVVRLWFAGVPR